jgi:hypothetical protein
MTQDVRKKQSPRALDKVKLRGVLALMLVMIVAGAIAVAAIEFTNLKPLTEVPKGHYADAILYNEQIRLIYSDEAVAIGNFTDDTLEPTGWQLFPSIFWDSNKNAIIENNESIGHSLSPSVHFTYDGQPSHFWPIHQSVMQDPADPNVLSSGWVSSPNIYRSKVEDGAQLITVETTVSVLDGNSSFTQEINITSTAPTPLANVNLITYIGIDINGPFDDIAFIDPSHNNMLKAYDNKTGNWFGVYPNSTATDFEVSIWNDGPYEGDDLWQHTLDETLIGSTIATGDVEASLRFYLNELQVGQSKTITLICSFAENETGLYAPEVEDRDVAVVGFETSKTGCLPVETIGQGKMADLNVTLENQGSGVETFNVTVYANSTQIVSQEVILNPSELQSVIFTWNTTGFALGNYSLQAEASLVPGEIDPADNVFVYGWTFVTIPGDIDGDRDVDIFDIVRMATIYGVVKPDPAYDPNCDIDNDGDIDIFDIVSAAGHYDESW